MSDYIDAELLILIIIGITIIIGSAVTVAVKIWPYLRKFNAIISDLGGEPERPGVPRKPGVMERLADVEEHAKSASYHSKPNGGKSGHDVLTSKLDYIDRKITDSQDDRKELWKAVQAITVQLREVKQRLRE